MYAIYNVIMLLNQLRTILYFSSVRACWACHHHKNQKLACAERASCWQMTKGRKIRAAAVEIDTVVVAVAIVSLGYCWYCSCSFCHAFLILVSIYIIIIIYSIFYLMMFCRFFRGNATKQQAFFFEFKAQVKSHEFSWLWRMCSHLWFAFDSV